MSTPTAASLLAKAFQLHRAGSLDEAAALYEAVLRERPDDAAALNNLGALRLQTGAVEQAIVTLSRFVAHRPRDPIGHSNLGHALLQADRAGEAEAPLRRAVELDPAFAQAHNHLGMALSMLDRADEAADAFGRALALQPAFAEAARNLGQTMNDAGDGARAAAAYRTWLRIEPANTRAQSGLALAEAMQGNLAEAIVALERLTGAHPDDWAAWQTLGLVRYWDGRLVEAEAAAHRVLALRPESREATFLVAGSRLGRGDYHAGWREFERRPEGSLGQSERFPHLPCWDGQDLPDRLLLHAEQGMGDVIQFARFVPLARQRVASVVLLLDQRWASLAPFVASVAGADATVTDLDELAASGARPIAARASILSLPYLLDNEVATIPNTMPYLRAPAAKVAQWARRFEGEPRLRVGVTWSVYARPRMRYVTQQRTVPFVLLERLLGTSGVRFVSLQKDPMSDAEQRAAGERLLDVSSELRDFGDTAGLIENLDLVISTDTSVAHVAGALGKPVWMLDRYNACWRWRLSATDSPWYPKMRIFRQPRLGDWETVLREVGEALAVRTGDRCGT